MLFNSNDSVMPGFSMELIRLLQQSDPQLHITDIDFSARQLAAARQRLQDHPLAQQRLTLQQMDAGNLE